MKMKLNDVPLGCFFTLGDNLCYKDNPTIGTDTNFCIVEDTYHGRPRHWLSRGYATNSKLEVIIIDERFLLQLTLF